MIIIICPTSRQKKFKKLLPPLIQWSLKCSNLNLCVSPKHSSYPSFCHYYIDDINLVISAIPKENFHRVWKLCFVTCIAWKSPNTKFILVRIFLYSAQTQEHTDREKLRIWTPFTQCCSIRNVCKISNSCIITVTEGLFILSGWKCV